MDFSIIIKALTSQQVILSVLAAVLTLLLCLGVRRWTKRYFKERDVSGGKAVTMRMIFTALRIAILVLGVMTILQINGIKLSGVITGVGIASAVLGLAMQDLLKDIIMGFHIISDHFYSEGDCVAYDGRECQVVSLTLKTTKLMDLEDHSVITLCNSSISSVRRLEDRMDFDLPLPYEESAAAVNGVLSNLQAAVAKAEGVKNCEYKGVQSFEESAVLYKLRVYCEPAARPEVRRRVLAVLQNGLADAGITIPYNQLQVHMDR